MAAAIGVGTGIGGISGGGMISQREYDKYTPAYVALNSKPPTETELKVNRVFMQYVGSVIQQESADETQRRKEVLGEIRNIFLKFVRKVALKEAKSTEDEVDEHLVSLADLFVSGSHRLGVKDIGADIDTVCVAPHFVKREHFFKDLKEELLNQPDVSNMNAVEDAFVPVMEFEYQGVAIDLLFARLGDNNQYPTDEFGKLNIMDDKILFGVDTPTMTSLNGPRVTNMISKLVEKSHEQFLIVLRCVRRWAKKRGLYGNKMGFLGGVNCNILVALICQLYPKACPYILLLRFFNQYKDWNWPEPIQLNNIQKLSIGPWDNEVWNPDKNVNDIMPLITPAYPAMNSSYNVNANTFQVMKEEFKRGYDVMIGLVKDKKWNQPETWGKLFEPSEFFLRYPHYLVCHIIGNDDTAQSRSWIGFVESRLRRLTIHPFLERLALLTPIHLYPVVSHTARSAQAVCYFIGFNIDHVRLEETGSKDLHIDQVVAQFVDGLWDPERGHNRGQRIDGLDFHVEHLTWKKLPREIFEIYGGYEQAKKLRKEMGYGQKIVRAVKEADAPKEIQAVNKPVVPSAPANAAELARSELLKDEKQLNDSHQSISTFPSVDQIKRKLIDADSSHFKFAEKQFLAKKPKLEADCLELPANYHLPNVTWQLQT